MGMLEFNPDGSLKVPESFKRKKIDLDNAIILDYENEYWSDTIDCKFTIAIPESINEEDFNKIENWVNDKIKTNSLSTTIELEKLSPNKFSLLISGKGHDNRCAWCKSFRTSLKNFCNREGIDFLQKDFCKFESEE